MALLTFYWSIDFLIFIITVLIGAYLYVTRKFLYWKKRGVMEIPPTPFTGNFTECLLAKKSPGQWLKDLYKLSTNLPFMGFYIFDRPFFLARDPELIKNILLRDFNYFSDRFVDGHDSISAANIFFLNNPEWKLVRTKLTPAFTSGKLKKMFELMLEVGEDLKTYLHSLNMEENGLDMEIKILCAKYTTDIMGTTIFGLNVNSLNNPEAEFRKHASEVFAVNFWRTIQVTAHFFAPQLVKPLGFQFLSEKNSEFLRRVVSETVAERKRSGIKRIDIIDRLIHLKESEADSPDKKKFEFTGDNLVAQATSLFLAGFETVSTAISFTLYELALSPDIQKKLRQEMNDALENSNGEITYDLVMKLSYMDMVVSEALRKYPSLPFLDRVTIADYKVPNTNLILEKGTPVYISTMGLHYDPEYYPDPEVFDPERFSEENKKNRKACVFMPFGEGPHNCIGMRFGLLETKLAIIHVISTFEVLPCEKTLSPMRLNPNTMFTTADGGLYLKIRKLVTASD